VGVASRVDSLLHQAGEEGEAVEEVEARPAMGAAAVQWHRVDEWVAVVVHDRARRWYAVRTQLCDQGGQPTHGGVVRTAEGHVSGKRGAMGTGGGGIAAGTVTRRPRQSQRRECSNSDRNAREVGVGTPRQWASPS